MAGGAASPVLFLVHGSTFSSRGSYDLQVPGRPGYSMMDHFAGLGFDVWTMDHEGYGFSSRTGSHAGIMVGVEDLKAALPAVERVTGQRRVMMFGSSAGAIRAAALAVAEPARVERLVSTPTPTSARMRRRSTAGAPRPSATRRTRAARETSPPSSASSTATVPAAPSPAWPRRWQPSS